MEPEQILESTRKLLPQLQALVVDEETRRDVHPQAVDLMRRAGLLRLYQPRRYGGLELPYGRLQVDIAATLGAISASLAWIQSGLSVHAWIVGNFPRSTQDAVWGSNPDALVATAFSDVGATVREADGGLVLNGTWRFSSGSSFSDWVVVRVAAPGPASGPVLRLCLLPRADVEIVDVWDPVGLRGTGSNDIKVSDRFVPASRSIELLALKGGATPPDPQASFLYRLPFMALFPFAVAAPALGVARGALAAFRREAMATPDRCRQVTRQLRFAEAAAQVDCAEMLLKASAQVVENALAARRHLSAGDKITNKRNYAFAVRLCREAVGGLVQDLGARGIQNDHPVQRAWRDVLAINSHFGVNWDVAGEYAGREAFGLPPIDPMV